MIEQIKFVVSRNLVNGIGWRSPRKIVVFESDDWGMIRMASKEAQENFIKNGYKIDECPYNLNDRLENDEDIESLSKVLLSVKDSRDNPAKFTINNIVANPDFEKIKKENFEKYYYEPFTKTLERQTDSQNVLSLFKEGISKNIFQPQLHGREHINLRLWFQRLQHGDPVTIDAFKQKMYSVHKRGIVSGRRFNLDAFGNKTLTGDFFNYPDLIREAQQIFKETWGIQSQSFIAPCYTWHSSLEKFLKEEGVRYLQGTYVQIEPVDNATFKFKKKYHYTGQRNKLGQYFLVRNCNFEPTEFGPHNAVKNALKEIELSFAYRKPAIISSHRVNYIGSLHPVNRRENLKLLKTLLEEIVKRWPDVEFMSSDILGSIISDQK
ncbi:hypothetical protein EI546_05955 [Aequorivita sp. H23M31]|uniref:Polysaccharide (De)acetylase n=1 Tax=Aequorivita ciconiae TaxID=2494375 RepID=A0A410G234_9FLAO|nr:hypothetical protein [Aequorivita sp. H23M31]QAA81299.1 hypothetical protein EI546_05955 [Aequorivita sp. H23M31]